jgi:diacylglycerol kinase (ATP)
MKSAKLFHNPGAGEEEHTPRDLIQLIEANGIESQYTSTKKEKWENLEGDFDFVIIAGGDGTVRKVTIELLKQNLIPAKLPIALLPCGTANNIATTLGIEGDTKHIVLIKGLDDSQFFVESFGYGLFPSLMKAMRDVNKDDIDSPEKELQLALKVLHKLTLTQRPTYCEVELDGVDYSGEYLLVEAMNINMIGPNLHLSPKADPGDDWLEVVLVAEEHREQLATYILDRINGKDVTYTDDSHKAKKVRLQWDGPEGHIDDKSVDMDPKTSIELTVDSRKLEFLIP